MNMKGWVWYVDRLLDRVDTHISDGKKKEKEKGGGSQKTATQKDGVI